jgi:hypothetical protein
MSVHPGGEMSVHPGGEMYTDMMLKPKSWKEVYKVMTSLARSCM